MSLLRPNFLITAMAAFSGLFKRKSSRFNHYETPNVFKGSRMNSHKNKSGGGKQIGEKRHVRHFGTFSPVNPFKFTRAV